MAARNVGEWSEIYAVARLLADEVPYDLTQNGEKIVAVKVQHAIAEPAIQYTLSENSIEVEQGSKLNTRLERIEISRLANLLLDDIRGKSKRTFQSEAGLRLVEILGFAGASAVLRDDIKILHFSNSPESCKGVSIKSFLGAKPTLLNASPATNFVFRLSGSSNALSRLASLRGLTMKPLFLFFRENDIDLEYVSMDSNTFENSLRSFSPDLVVMVAELLRQAAFQPRKKLADVWGLVFQAAMEKVPKADYGLLRFLGAVGFGLQPATPWVPRTSDFGGFLTVKADGHVELMSEANMADLGAQLFKELRFEWGSRTRHQFGIPYRVGEDFMIKLNLQLRF